MCAFCGGQDHEPVELDEFTQRRYQRMSPDEMWEEFQRTIEEYNERHAQ